MTREEALRYAQHRIECHSKGDGSYTKHGEFLVSAIEALQEPERKKGHWIYHADDLFPADSTQECSSCHERELFTLRNDSYCPNCGADMRGERE